MAWPSIRPRLRNVGQAAANWMLKRAWPLRVVKLVGEFFREAGVLLVVFGPLDGLIQEAANQPLSVQGWQFAVAGATLLLLGIVLEVFRLNVAPGVE